MAQPIVFFDIAGPDDAVLINFYSSIFGWEIDQAGQFDVPVATLIKGAIRKDPTEKRIYSREKWPRKKVQRPVATAA